jgi:hypothetical protein
MRALSIAVSIATLAIVGLVGCTTTAIMYSGPPLDREQVAVVSTVWGSPSRKIAARVVTVDGKPFESANHRELHIPPGAHTLEFQVRSDGTVSISGTTITSSWNQMTLSVASNLEAGHTYVGRAERVGRDSARVVVEDRGLKYPERCMPLALVHSGQPMDACDSAQ